MTTALFIGNSFIYFNDLPNVLKDMFGHGFEHDQVTPGGQSLIGHSKDKAVLNAFERRSSTFVVLQDNSQVPGGYDEKMVEETHRVLETYFAPRLRKNNSVPIFFETWGMLWFVHAKYENTSHTHTHTHRSSERKRVRSILQRVSFLLADAKEDIKRIRRVRKVVKKK
jgi:hypothetical protein